MNDNDMREAIAATLKTVSAMDEKLDAVCAEVKDHRTILQGPPANGNSPGLRTRMDRIEQDRERDRKEDRKRNKKQAAQAKVAFGILGGIAITVFGLAANLIFDCFVSH